ncbi:hypothetical protein EJB05_07541, partial [Eragrostis curvula]
MYPSLPLPRSASVSAGRSVPNPSLSFPWCLFHDPNQPSVERWRGGKLGERRRARRGGRKASGRTAGEAGRAGPGGEMQRGWATAARGQLMRDGSAGPAGRRGLCSSAALVQQADDGCVFVYQAGNGKQLLGDVEPKQGLKCVMAISSDENVYLKANFGNITRKIEQPVLLFYANEIPPRRSVIQGREEKLQRQNVLGHKIGRPTPLFKELVKMMRQMHVETNMPVAKLRGAKKRQLMRNEQSGQAAQAFKRIRIRRK